MPPMPEDEWAEVEEQIPSMEEPFLVKYIQGREMLIEEEKKQRSGTLYPQDLSPPGTVRY